MTRFQLRPYQQDAVNRIRFSFMQGHRRVLFVLPTGGGKTVVFCHISEQAAAKGNRVVILVHRAELVTQTCRSLERAGVGHGVVQAGRSEDLSHAVQVASVQTLARRLHRFPADFFQLLVVDEAHHTNAGTWRSVVEHFSRARVLGVTATPCRLDGRGLGEHYDQMVVGPSPAWLTEQGFLARAKVYTKPVAGLQGLRTRMGDYDMRQAGEVFGEDGVIGRAVEHYLELVRPGGTMIAFCCSVEHAEQVAEQYRQQGIEAASIDGTMGREHREELLARLGAGDLKVLTSCQLIGEGIDVPSVDATQLLRPTQSVSLYLQMVGRGLRPSPGKDHAVVLDHAGCVMKHGHHLEEREWTLEGVKKKAKRTAISVRECPQCLSACPSAQPACPCCGFVFPRQPRETKVVDGCLVEITPAEAARRARRRQQGAARTMEELVAMGRERGMSNPEGWARHVLNGRMRRR